MGRAEEQHRVNSPKEQKGWLPERSQIRVASECQVMARRYHLESISSCDKKNQRCRSRRVCSRPQEGRAVVEWEPEPSSRGLPSCLLWVAPANFVTGSRSQPLLDALTPCLQNEGISKAFPPSNIFTPSVLCNKHHNLSSLKQHTGLCHSFCGAGVWARLIWMLCSGSYKGAILVSAGLFLSGAQGPLPNSCGC